MKEIRNKKIEEYRKPAKAPRGAWPACACQQWKNQDVNDKNELEHRGIGDKRHRNQRQKG